MTKAGVLVLLFCYGCGASIRGLPVDVGEGWFGPEPRLVLRYLGAGGVEIRRGDAVLLTAPFFSNPSLWRVLGGRISTVPERIDRALSPWAEALVPLEAILVGHAHYDHLLDLPYIAARYAPAATIYGSRTAVNTLRAALRPERLLSVEESAGTPEQPGPWHRIAGGQIRFMALRSGHAPHFAGRKFYGGHHEAPLDALPSRAGGWREGTTLSYLIDFLGPGGQVEFRIYYQDAASTPPAGFPPPLVAGGPATRVDVAILCASGFEQVKGYPEGIIQHLNPRAVVLIHWEDFFRPLPQATQYLRLVPRLDLEGLVRRVEGVLPPDARLLVPAPGARLGFGARDAP